MKEMPKWLYWLMTPFMLLLAEPKPVKGLKKLEVIEKILSMKSCDEEQKKVFQDILKSKGGFVNVEELGKLTEAVMGFYHKKHLLKHFTFGQEQKERVDMEFDLAHSECLTLIQFLSHKAHED